MEWKIVVDTACDFREIPNKAENVTYERVPFSLQIEDKVYVDTLDLDIDEMMREMYASSEAARSACPSPEAYLSAYRGAENVIVLTLTGGMSGSYNSAVIGEKMLKEENENVNIHIVNTLSAGGQNDLFLLKINELIKEGLSFDEVVSKMNEYQKNTKLIFSLEKVDNLVKNGRLSKLAAAVVGLLNMRMVGEASNEGTLHLLHKVRGEKKAISTVPKSIKNPYLPTWGREYAFELLIRYYIQNKKMNEARKYVQMAEKEYPNSYFIGEYKKIINK